MIQKITLQKTGESLTAAIPQEMAARFKLEAGDEVYAVETTEGLLLTPRDPDTEDAMRAFSAVRGQYRDTLRRLSQ